MTLVFKSEEEKQRAIDEIPEPDFDEAPVGISHEDFLKENEKKLEEVMNAEINSEEVQEETQEENDINLRTDTPVVESSEETPEPIIEPEVTPQIDQLQKRNDALLQQREELLVSNENRIKELEDKINSLQTNKTEQVEIPKTGIDDEIVRIQSQIEDLEKEMNDPDYDLSPYDQDYINNMKKSNKLSIKLNSLISQKNNELFKQQKSEIEKLKNNQRLERESDKKQQDRDQMLNDIEQFRLEHDELKGVPYKEMDQVYTDFALEVASEYFGKPLNQVTAKDTELAMIQYKNQTPQLMQKLSTKGLTEPNGLEQFMVLSDVHFLKSGLVLNKQTGNWEQLKDGRGNKVMFPNHKAAYSYYQDLNGTKGREMLNAQKKSQESMMSAINKRADVKELDSDHRKVDLGEMSKEDATRIIESVDEEQVAMRARRNYDDPLVSEYNKALNILGYATIKRDDV